MNEYEALLERYWQGKAGTGRETFPVRINPPWIPHGLVWNRARASEVTSRRLTALAMTRLNSGAQFDVISVLTKLPTASCSELNVWKGTLFRQILSDCEVYISYLLFLDVSLCVFNKFHLLKRITTINFFPVIVLFSSIKWYPLCVKTCAMLSFTHLL